MKPTKEDLDRFRIEIMTGGRSEDMIIEKENEQLQIENAKLKQEKENLTTIVANKIIEDFDIETPLKDELNNARLEIISLEEALHLERQDKEELKEWLEDKKMYRKKQILYMEGTEIDCLNDTLLLEYDEILSKLKVKE